MGTEELEAQIKAASDKVIALKGSGGDKPAIDAAVTSTSTHNNQYILKNVASTCKESVALVSLLFLRDADVPSTLSPATSSLRSNKHLCSTRILLLAARRHQPQQHHPEHY